MTDAEDRELWRRTIRTGDPDLSGEANRRIRNKIRIDYTLFYGTRPKNIQIYN